jgi:hypothetical protein
MWNSILIQYEIIFSYICYGRNYIEVYKVRVDLFMKKRMSHVSRFINNWNLYEDLTPDQKCIPSLCRIGDSLYCITRKSVQFARDGYNLRTCLNVKLFYSFNSINNLLWRRHHEISKTVIKWPKTPFRILVVLVYSSLYIQTYTDIVTIHISFHSGRGWMNRHEMHTETSK